ncbi:hypothetical protein GC170_18240 [bacterium]|nr:hypothetical protein [bacterium]
MSQEPTEPREDPISGHSRHSRHAFLLASGLFGIFIVAQIAGIEVVGGDPDRFFRPLKSELVRSLSSGELPLWSDRFGFGMPLAAESEVGAFYTPHWFIYPAFGTSLGYRVSQCLHQYLALAFSYLLARRLGAMPLGAALGAMIFVLGGFPTIQASKEWAILGMAWMPAAFLGTETWLDSGWNRSGRRGLSLLSISLACLALIGHFQMAQLTSLGLAIWVSTRTFADRSLLRRWPGLLVAVTLAAAIASPQLALSFQYADSVGALNRSLSTLSYYSYPVECLTELAVPLWTRRVAGGPEGAFWTLRNTTRFEAAMFAGTAGLILAIIGIFTRAEWENRSFPLLALIIAGFGISTMPQWSVEGYATLIELPGMGLFRCPGRYGVLAHLGLALAAARGWGRWPNAGSIVAILATFISSAWFLRSFLSKPLIAPGIGAKLPVVDSAVKLAGFTDPLIFVVTLVSFYFFAILILLSLTRPKLKVLLFLLATCELTYFYFAGPTRWGWSLGLPESSSLLTRLAEESANGPVMVGGKLDNVPVTAGATTAAAYFGVSMPTANELLKTKIEVITSNINRTHGAKEKNPFLSMGVRYSIDVVRPSPGSWIEAGKAFPYDPLSEAIPKTMPGPRTLYLTDHLRPDSNLPDWAYTARGFSIARDHFSAFDQLFSNPTIAAFERQHEFQRDDSFNFGLLTSDRLDTEATVITDRLRLALTVRHSRTALIILRRTYDEGWLAIDESSGQEYPIRPVFGGIQAITVPSSGTRTEMTETKIRLKYRPVSLAYTIPASVISSIFIMLLSFARRNRNSSKEPIPKVD